MFVTEVYQELRKMEDSMADMTGRTELKAITPIIRNNLYKPTIFTLMLKVKTSNSKAKRYEETLDWYRSILQLGVLRYNLSR